MNDTPAFPVLVQEDAITKMEDSHTGLSKREYAAVQIAASIMGHNMSLDTEKAMTQAVKAADILLRKLDE